MKKTTSQKTRKQKTSKTASHADKSTSGARRTFLKTFRNGMFAIVAFGALGGYAYSAYQKDVAERDLSKIGNGIPTVVQVHDPACSLCNQLQRNARSTLGEFDDGDIAFLVANVTTQAGQAFAAKYQVPSVTLVLFDGNGDLQNVVQGVQPQSALKQSFSQLLEKK